MASLAHPAAALALMGLVSSGGLWITIVASEGGNTRLVAGSSHAMFGYIYCRTVFSTNL